jgi:hypothetical protein
MKVMNIVFGIGIAVIVFIVALLGIQAFYPAPEYEDFCKNDYYYAKPMPVSSIYDCPGNITVTECIAIINENEKNASEYQIRDNEMQECNTKFNEAQDRYGKTFFLIACALGLIALIASFFLLNYINISAGVAFAGIVLIIVAFVRGWRGTDDIVKFITGVVIAVVIVYLTLKINNRFADSNEEVGSNKETANINTEAPPKKSVKTKKK